MSEKEVQALNAILDESTVGKVLSTFGRNLYFPQGVMAQSVQAAKKATNGNATVGVAMSQGRHITLTAFSEAAPLFAPDSLVGYAPAAGLLSLRQRWLQWLQEKNPDLMSDYCTLPVVTNGITGALSLAGDLFVDRGDSMVILEPYWDNYQLLFGTRYGAQLATLPIFDNDLLNVKQLQETILAQETQKVLVLINFPHNPTGYSPTVAEAHQLVASLIACAEQGKELVVIVDDAYFGLFYDQKIYQHSLFAHLSSAHENIVAIKCDGATKELLAWGLRLGFFTVGSKSFTSEAKEALHQKVLGALRSSISSCSQLSQTFLLHAIEHPNLATEVNQAHQEMVERWEKAQKALAKQQADWDLLKPLPFNSGYFFTFECAGDAEALRVHLLHTEGIGTISLGDNYLRIAYSQIDSASIETVISAVYQGARKLWR